LITSGPFFPWPLTDVSIFLREKDQAQEVKIAAMASKWVRNILTNNNNNNNDLYSAVSTGYPTAPYNI